jgi:hypothetical protein
MNTADSQEEEQQAGYPAKRGGGGSPPLWATTPVTSPGAADLEQRKLHLSAIASALGELYRTPVGPLNRKLCNLFGNAPSERRG